MRKGYSKYRIFKPFISLGIFLLIAGLATYFSLKVIKENKKKAEHKGKIAVPSSYVDIPAYTKITREYLDFIYLDPKKLPKNVITDLKSVLGRVLNDGKKKGYVFTEDDFLPEGTRQGIVGAIAPGKRAFTIETDKVQGLFGLKVEDRFDMMGLIKISSKKGQSAGLIGSTATAAQTGDEFIQPTMLVKNGTIIVPVRIREVPYSQTSLTAGTTTRTKPVRETVIAIDMEEVQGLAQAISMNAELFVVPRSGQPGGEEKENKNFNMGLMTSGVAVVETIKGNERSREAVPVIR
jgi:Flp pilus assembly protein CpaB